MDTQKDRIEYFFVAVMVLLVLLPLGILRNPKQKKRSSRRPIRLPQDKAEAKQLQKSKQALPRVVRTKERLFGLCARSG